MMSSSATRMSGWRRSLLKRHFAAVGLDRLIAAPAQIDDDKTSDVGLVFQNQNFLHIGFLPSNDGAGLQSV